MARLAVPGLPHHVTARGNRREPIFFEDGDQELYADLLAGQARRAAEYGDTIHISLAPGRSFRND